MIKAVRIIFQDVKQGKNIESYTIIGLAITIAVLDIFGEPDPSWLSEVTLAALALLAYGRIQDRRTIETLVRQDINLPITCFRVGRAKLPSLIETLDSAGQEIFIVGIELALVVHAALAHLEKKAQFGCKVRLLMLRHDMPDGHPNPLIRDASRLTGLPNRVGTFRDVLVTNKRNLLNWINSLSPAVRTNIELRIYYALPTATAVFLDPSLAQGFARVEPLLYGMRPEERFSFDITRLDNPAVFEFLYSKYNSLWEVSEAVDTTAGA